MRWWQVLLGMVGSMVVTIVTMMTLIITIGDDVAVNGKPYLALGLFVVEAAALWYGFYRLVRYAQTWPGCPHCSFGWNPSQKWLDGHIKRNHPNKGCLAATP